MRQFDYTALSQPVTFKELWAEAQNNKVYAAIALFFSVWIVGFCIITLSKAKFGALIAPIFFAIGMYTVLILTWRDNIFLKRFTARNNLKYVGKDYPINLPGLIFGIGDTRGFEGGFTDINEKWLLANYQYTTGSGKNKKTRSFGILRLRLPRQLPHVLLDATGNNFITTNLPTNFSADQKLSLEGDFNNFFTVYVPQGYQRDVLYFLTPELMQILVDYGSEYDFEVVDDSLFVYTSRLDLGRKNMQKSIEKWLQFAEYLSKEFDDNVRLYADSRIDNSRHTNMVTTEGRRLKRGTAWGSVATLCILVACYILLWLA